MKKIWALFLAILLILPTFAACDILDLVDKPDTEETECIHQGGVATCTSLAVCTKCKAEYGALDPTAHKGSEEWKLTETSHASVYSCCGGAVRSEESHEWTDGVCVQCGYVCVHKGGEGTCQDKGRCEICAQEYVPENAENHAEPPKWTKTADTHTNHYDCCGITTVKDEPHEWSQGVCVDCGYRCTHISGKLQWVKTEATHGKAYSCCNFFIIAEEEHRTVNGVCTVCKYGCTHRGGVATCQSEAICTDCSEPYGEKDITNHTLSAKWTNTETTHKKIYACCGTVVVEAEKHEWSEGVCGECGYTCVHRGGESTCKSGAVCEVCGTEYGEIDPDNHEEDVAWVQDNTKHGKAYGCCGEVVLITERHEWSDGSCTECGHVCSHTGGTATCTEKAICRYCGSGYGSLDANNHTEAEGWVKTATTHARGYSCCGKTLEEVRDHELNGKICGVCDFEPTVSVESVVASADDEQVTVEIAIADNPGITGLMVTLEYNENYFALTQAQNGDALNALDFTAPDELKNGCSFLWDGLEISDEDIKNGVILTLTFDAFQYTPNGVYSIFVKVSAYDNDLRPFTVTIDSGNITIDNA